MKQHSHTIDVVVGLLLFCVFTASMLFVLLAGADAYKSISTSMEQQYSERTCLNYIAAKVRHHDSNGGVYITEFEGINALALDEEFNGEIYQTLIYYYNGNLCELFTAEDSGVMPDDGFVIIAADGASFEIVRDSLIRVECSVGGRSESVFISRMSKKAVM